jgi:hypothetical protein
MVMESTWICRKCNTQWTQTDDIENCPHCSTAIEYDPVDKPKHYNFGKFEVIEVIEDWDPGYHLGNVIKYVARAKHKGKYLEDLKKAQWYLNRAIEAASQSKGLFNPNLWPGPEEKKEPEDGN